MSDDLFLSQYVCTTSTCASSPGDVGDYPETGPYMTVEEFFNLAAAGALGPDEDCRWVSISPLGVLVETPIVTARRVDMPPQTIAVAYYDK